MSKETLKFLISTSGEIKFIYSDAVASLLKEGEASITRVSNVEPTGLAQWEARMDDGKVLGPFNLRSEALAAEVTYLEERMFKSETSSKT